MEKNCSRCSQLKPYSDFSRRATTSDGLQVWCKACMREKARERAPQNREYNARWRAENPDLARAATLRWRTENPERLAAAKRKWAQENRESIRRSRERNAAKRAEALAAWKVANRDKVREYQRKRRAAGYGGAIGEVDGESLWELCGGLCAICTGAIDVLLAWPDPQSISLDHIVPLSAGGAHETENCRWTHLVCNLRKGSR